MQRRLSLNWTALALRGVVAIAFGVVAFLLPGLTLGALILLFAAFAIVDGVSALVTGLRHPTSRRPDWLLIAGGVAGIVVGLIAVFLPGITALFLVSLIGAWAIITGIAQVAIAWQLRKEIQGELVLALNGILAVVFGIYLWLFPGLGAISLVWLIALFAVVSGVMLLVLAFRMRNLAAGDSGNRSGSSVASA
jgi:uncharacterized membrane protein HdeD (DUF308 family)